MTDDRPDLKTFRTAQNLGPSRGGEMGPPSSVSPGVWVGEKGVLPDLVNFCYAFTCLRTFQSLALIRAEQHRAATRCPQSKDLVSSLTKQ